MKRNWNLFLAFTKAYWQAHTQYRLGAIVWVINGLIQPLVLMGLWLVVGGVRTDVSADTVVTYYLLTMVVMRLTQSWAGESLVRMIKEGTFSKFMVKPYGLLVDRLSMDQAHRLLRLSTLIPFVAFALYFWRFRLDLTLTVQSLTVVLIALVIGYGINLVFDCILGMCSFWLEETYGAFLLFMMVRDLLSGMTIPLLFMPVWLRAVSVWLPFYGTVGFPIDVLTGRSTGLESWGYLGFMTLYLIFLGILGRKMYFSLIKKYTAVGN